MIVTIIVVGVLSALLITCLYVIRNLLRKVEVYETAIEKYYNNTTTILRTARELDNMQMFEKDDDVGSLFQQLMITIGELRAVVYEEVYDNETGKTE